MPTTNIQGPTTYSTLGTALGDGNNYVSWTYPERMLSSGTNVCVASGSTAGNRGNLWKGCFNTEIPTGATITGVELVANASSSHNARFGNAGSTGFSESLTYRMYVYNGSSYAEAAFLATPAGGSLSSDSMELTLTGSNRYYKNNSYGTDVLAGSSTELFGLTWNPSDQQDFGFVILTNAQVDTPVGVISGRGDIGLRITYISPGYNKEVDGVAPGDIFSITNVLRTSVLHRSFPGNYLPPINLIYKFEGETTNTSPTGNWSPQNGWVNGFLALNGVYWGRTSNKPTKGWNCDNLTTPSSSTGPNDGVADGNTGYFKYNTKYLYTEVSSSRYAYCFVARTPVIPQMNDTSNNLTLKFWVHAYGSQIGDLYVYIDDATTSNHQNATELAAYESWSNFSSQYSPYQQKTISLNNYRDNSTDYYIYFVSQNATGFRGDLAIDSVQIIED